jgi:hypothetical protein
VAKDQSEDAASDSDDIVVLTKAKIQATLEEAASLGRLTRSAASEILSELLSIAQRQTDSFLSEISDLTRRAGPPSFPIDGFEELTVAQVRSRLDGLSGPELRQIRDFERKHANRKSLLDALDKALDERG